jgi:hypothetical protein
MAILAPKDQAEGLAQKIADHLNGRNKVSVSDMHVAWPEKGEDSYGFSRTDNNGGVRADGAESSLREFADNLRSETTELVQRYLDSAEPTILKSVRPRADDEGREGSVRGREYGTHQEGSTRVVGRHYAPEQRERLSSHFYGTGLKGAESRRLDSWNATSEQRKRIHFYVDEGNGIKPEAGVGAHAHETQLNNLYNTREDALGFRAEGVKRYATDADVFNHIEQQAMAHGFDGVYTPKAQGNQGVAVLLGGKHTDVPVDYKGTVGQPLFSKKQTETPEFKKWFGDSKVVDEEGKPLVVYHGTGNLENLRAFDPGLTGQGNDQLGSGFYFTTDPEEASGYTTSVTSNAGPEATKLGGDTPPASRTHLSLPTPSPGPRSP